MNIYVEHVENDFNSLLQKEIRIMHKDKVLKEGRLVLFSLKDFYLDFQMLTKASNKIIHYELPFPFKYTNLSNKITLSYLQAHFTKNDPEVEHSILVSFIKSPSKLYNSEVFIHKLS